LFDPTVFRTVEFHQRIAGPLSGLSGLIKFGNNNTETKIYSGRITQHTHKHKVTFYSRSHSPITHRSRHHHTTPVTVADSDLQAQTEGVLNNVENGWAERAPEIGPEGRTWYLPHHAVYQGEGKEKKSRVVFDGSARYGQTSLNRQLEVG
ncbi:hypothetical protein T12_16504, partial [Trichinella patagoniensis]